MIGSGHPISDASSAFSHEVRCSGQQPSYQPARSTLGFASLSQLEAPSSTQSLDPGSILCQTSQASSRNDTPSMISEENVKEQTSWKSCIPPAYLYNSLERHIKSPASASSLVANKASATTQGTKDDPLHSRGPHESNVHLRSQLSGELADDRELSSRGRIIDCNCVRCLAIHATYWPTENNIYHCRICGCKAEFGPRDPVWGGPHWRRDHEIDHFRAEGGFACQEHECIFKTSRWNFLLRHCTSKHCKCPQLHPCPEIGCDRKGEKGFKRVDKLKSHMDEVHRGKKRARKAISSKGKANASKPVVSDAKK